MYGASAGATLGKRKERSTREELPALDLPPAVRAALPAESELFDSLAAFTRDADAAFARSVQTWHGYFARKREGGVGKAARVLRLCVYNTHTNQDAHYAVGEGLAAPRWTLRVEGRLLPDPGVPDAGAEAPIKFSHFIKHISVELDQSLYKNDWFVEWDSRRHVGATDGFELTREGARDTTAKVLIEVAYPLQLYTLSAPLAALVGVECETHDAVLRLLWHHFKAHGLLKDAQVACNDALKALFGHDKETLTLDELPALVRRHLTPAPPIVIEHAVRVSGSPQDTMQLWDVQVQDVVLPLVKSGARNSEAAVECDKELAQVLEQISAASKRQRAFAELARDPAQFVHTLARSNARDIALLNLKADAEAQRSADFYYHPYVVDASRQYLARQMALATEQREDDE